MHSEFTLLSPQDLHLFNEGTHGRLHAKFGAHLVNEKGSQGAYFAVWAPNAERVAVMGDFNEWRPSTHPLACKGDSGIWEGYFPGILKGQRYKFHVESKHEGYQADKRDPFSLYCEPAPATGSIVWDLDYDWSDAEWMQQRSGRNNLAAPISIYEVHLGSWARIPEEDNRFLTYRELAPKLAAHALEMGFTHIEFLPVMEHPFYGSWGYQTTGYFAPTSRYGTPQDFMFLIDHLHRSNIGVILDWVPSHFPTDEHGLGYFDGTHLYEHADPRKGFHPDWNSFIFNYGRKEVRSFLLSSAHHWLTNYHADGIRVDAVASMLYLDYSRKEGEWIPNEHGGRENLEAIEFIRMLNEQAYRDEPAVQMIAEESTAWPLVSHPTYAGGLGFGMKWDMGWMHDTLRYFKQDPINRKYHHSELSFRQLYAFTENFLLPLSHDEVVHGKGSLLGQMPGDDWQRFANLRLLYGYMFAQPGKKLMFMGDEFGQVAEWRHDESLEWHLLDHPRHSGLKAWVSALNSLYRSSPALYEFDCQPEGFEWVDASDTSSSIISFLRKAESSAEIILAVMNFTPIPRSGYLVGVPKGGFWREMANSDKAEFGGSGQGNEEGAEASTPGVHGRRFALSLTLPPLACVLLKHEPDHPRQ